MAGLVSYLNLLLLVWLAALNRARNLGLRK